MSKITTSLPEHLPPPPPDRSDWPWTEAVDPACYAGRAEWPKISIVTPSYQQGHYLEETIRSVLLQNYPNLEYLVLDGGSTDGTVDVLHKYAPWLTYWVSEPDGGQTQAINKGFRRVTGELTGWINSDDVFLPGAFYEVASQLDPAADFIYGQCLFLTPDGRIEPGDGPTDQLRVRHAADFPYPSQPSCFWRPRLFAELGYLDESYHFSMDFDFFVRVGLNKPIQRIEPRLTQFRWHDASKTSNLQHIHNANRQVVLSKVINSFRDEFPALDLAPFLHSTERYPVQVDFSEAEKKSILAYALKTLLLIAYTNLELGQVQQMGRLIKTLDPVLYQHSYVKNLYRRSLLTPRQALVWARKWRKQ